MRGAWRRLRAPASGRVLLDGHELRANARERTREQRRRIQIVFQNPDASLNPRQRVRELVGWPAEAFLNVRGTQKAQAVSRTLELVRLDERLASRFPWELSGGEKQRVAIARALVADPDVLICDEITSALDVSVQAAIIELLDDLRHRLDTGVIFISHDLAIVRTIADRILVLRNGEPQELSTPAELFERPASEYTRSLVDAERTWSLRLASAGSR